MGSKRVGQDWATELNFYVQGPKSLHEDICYHRFLRDWLSCLVTDSLPRILPFSKSGLSRVAGPEGQNFSSWGLGKATMPFLAASNLFQSGSLLNFTFLYPPLPQSSVLCSRSILPGRRQPMGRSWGESRGLGVPVKPVLTLTEGQAKRPPLD